MSQAQLADFCQLQDETRTGPVTRGWKGSHLKCNPFARAYPRYTLSCTPGRDWKGTETIRTPRSPRSEIRPRFSGCRLKSPAQLCARPQRRSSGRFCWGRKVGEFAAVGSRGALVCGSQPFVGGQMMRAMFAGVVAVASVVLATPAAAEPDPHMPNPQANYCPGGGAGSMIYAGYCDGVPYPDGSFWHYIQYGIPLVGHPAGLLSPGMQCVVPNGAIPAPAPPGGCAGAV